MRFVMLRFRRSAAPHFPFAAQGGERAPSLPEGERRKGRARTSPLPSGEEGPIRAPREWEVRAAARSSRPPPCRSLRPILEDHALLRELVTDAVGLLEVLRLARGEAMIDELGDLRL